MILGITDVDSHFPLDYHVSNTVQSRNYHFRSLRRTEPLIDRDVATTIACGTVTSRIDYCNAVICGATAANVTRLRRTQSHLSRILCKTL